MFRRRGIVNQNVKFRQRGDCGGLYAAKPCIFRRLTRKRSLELVDDFLQTVDDGGGI